MLPQQCSKIPHKIFNNFSPSQQCSLQVSLHKAGLRNSAWADKIFHIPVKRLLCHSLEATLMIYILCCITVPVVVNRSHQDYFNFWYKLLKIDTLKLKMAFLTGRFARLCWWAGDGVIWLAESARSREMTSCLRQSAVSAVNRGHVSVICQITK